jgi:hypothetical protein
MASEFGTSSNKAHSARNQRNPQPARGRHVFMKGEFRNHGEQDNSKRTGGQHVGEIGPGKRSHIAGKKTKQKKNSQCYPGISDRKQKTRDVLQRNIPHLFHSVREQGVSHGREYADSSQYQILAESHEA